MPPLHPILSLVSSLCVAALLASSSFANDLERAGCTGAVCTDLEPPVALCAAPSFLSIPAGGIAILDPADFDAGSSDDCELQSFALSRSQLDCSDVDRTNPVILEATATDAAGKTDTCEVEIDVRDTLTPIALCKDATVELIDGMVVLTGDEIDDGSFDNCGVDSFNLFPTATYDCDDLGTQEVRLIVNDVNAIDSSCLAMVTFTDPSNSCDP